MIEICFMAFITEHNQRQTYYLSWILNYFDIFLSESKGSSIISTALS